MQDVNKSVRIGCDTLLYGNVKDLNASIVPFYAFTVPTGENPDKYVLYQFPGNTNIYGGSMINIKATIQFAINVKSATDGSDESENIAQQIDSLLQPDAIMQPIVLNGFQVIEVKKINDIPTIYPDITTTAQNNGASKLINERILTYSLLLLDMQRFYNY